MSEPTTAIGFVVAGGESRRMGHDKALLRWDTATLLDHTIDRLRRVCHEVRILSGPEPRYADRGLPVDVDRASNVGPLAGLYTGLLRLDESPGLFLAVDLPRVPVALLERLVALALGHDAVVPVSPGGPEPLCAVYAAACAAPVRRCLDSGHFKMTSFWPDVRVRQVGGPELAAFGDPAEMFRNVNTPEDYDAAIGQGR